MAIQLPYPTPNPATSEWDPFALLQNMKFLARAIDVVSSGQLVPSGAILFMASGSTCPTGYTKITTYTGKFLRMATTAGGTGSASLTSSTPTSTTTVQSGAGATVASSTHLHTASALTPAFVDVVMCQKV